LDNENRVLRYDTFSKSFSTGFRVGWVSGTKFIIERIGWDLESGAQSASSIPQMMIHDSLKQLGEEGWRLHVQKCALFYRNRRDAAIECAKKYLQGLAEWTTPTAGMFLWFKLKGVKDGDIVVSEGVKKKLLFVPGSAFSCVVHTSPYIRVSFSNVTLEQMDIGFQRLAELLRDLQASGK